MAIFDLFSRKQRDAERDSPDVFRYDDIPHELRIQLLHALDDARKRIYPPHRSAARLDMIHQRNQGQ